MKTSKGRYASIKNSGFSRRWLAVLAGLVLVAIIVVVLALNNGESESPATSSAGNQGSGQSSNLVSDKVQGSPSNSSVASGQAPKTPYGNFVSSHTARLKDAEFSNCSTSSGAKCKISFSKDGSTKSLDEKTVDTDGAVYWTWKPQDIDLTTGSWQITATATLNGKTSSTTDARNFVITP